MGKMFMTIGGSRAKKPNDEKESHYIEDWESEEDQNWEFEEKDEWDLEKDEWDLDDN